MAANGASAADGPVDRALSDRGLEHFGGYAREAGARARRQRRDRYAPRRVALHTDDRCDRARPGARAARRRQLALAERPHALSGYWRALSPRRPDGRLRFGRVGLDRPLLRCQPNDRPRRRGADPGADADSPGRERRPSGSPPGALARRQHPGLARARDVAAASGDGRTLGRARHARLELARPPSC